MGFSSLARDGSMPPALEAWNLNHWTTGKSQSLLFNALNSWRIWGWLWFFFKPNITHDLLEPCPINNSFGISYGSLVKNLPANAGDAGSIPGLGRSPGEGNGYSLQYCCLGNPMDRRDWQASAHGVAKSQTWLRDRTQTHTRLGWAGARWWWIQCL